jgi:hypothetical protein
MQVKTTSNVIKFIIIIVVVIIIRIMLYCEPNLESPTLEYSPNYFSEYLFVFSSKHETTWELQNGSLVQLHTSVSDRKGVGNILGRHVLKAFSALPSHS